MPYKRLENIIRLTPAPLFFGMVGSVLIGLYYSDYASIYHILNEVLNSSLITSIFILAVGYRSKLCFYYKVPAWAMLISSLLNLFMIFLVDPNNYILYTTIYAHFLLIPTSIMVAYFLIKKI